MTSLKVFNPSNPEFRIDVVVIHDRETVIQKIQEPIDLVLTTSMGATIVIPQKLKETLYFKIIEHAES